jgi:cytochrome c biogenesis protein ResB
MREKFTYPAVWNRLKRVWRFLVRTDVAAVLIFVVLLVTALGSCFPQVSPATVTDASRWARWETDLRARYGALTDLLAAGGAFRWFQSPSFLIPFVLLIVITLACTLDRWQRVWRRAFRQPVHCTDLVFDAAPYSASLTALGTTPLYSTPSYSTPSSSILLTQITRETLEQHGFRVRSEIADDSGRSNATVHLRGDRNRLAPLATLLNHLAVLLLLLGAVLSSGYGWHEELTLAPGATVAVGHGSDLSLRNERFTIARYPDDSAASYDAEVTVIQGGKEIDHHSAQVNKPLTFDGIAIYLQSYKETEGSLSVTLLAVHDPGYDLVIAAGFLLLLGLVVIFYFPHCAIHAQIRPEGTLRLAGEIERQAFDFDHEFAALVKEIELRCS